jgi:hypothetical protein
VFLKTKVKKERRRIGGWKDVPFFVVRGRNHVVDAGYENVTFWIDELAHEGNEICHGLVHHTPKDARMKISRRTGDRNLVIGQATESICERGCASVEPIVIRLKRNCVESKKEV